MHVSAGAHRTAAVLAVASAVVYSFWLGAGLVNPEHAPMTAYVSELAATDQPFSTWFRAFDATSGAALAAACGIVLAAGRRADRAWTPLLPFILLGLFGLSTVADALAPLSCAATSDLACAQAEKAGTVPFAHRLHTVTSSAAGACASAAMIAWLFLTRRPTDRAAPPPSRGGDAAIRIGSALVAVHLVALAISLVDIAGAGLGILGAAQRISLLTLAAWWPLLFLLRRPTGETASGQPTPSESA